MKFEMSKNELQHAKIKSETKPNVSESKIKIGNVRSNNKIFSNFN